jgi:hypothetical protein
MTGTQVIVNAPNVTTQVGLKNRAPGRFPDLTPGGAVGDSELPWGRVSDARLEYLAVCSRNAVKAGPK